MTAKAVKKVLAVGPDKSLRLVCPECGEAKLIMLKVEVPHLVSQRVSVMLRCEDCKRNIDMDLRTKRSPAEGAPYTTVRLMAITY